MDETKVKIINKLTDGPLCGCGSLPTHEIVYHSNKWSLKPDQIERYCQDCIKKELSLFHQKMSLRIRDNATVKELNFPKDVLEALQMVVSSNTTSHYKHLMIKKLSDGSACCVCGGLPTHEVIYHLDGATQIERYCESCIKKVYERTPVL